MRLWTVQSEEWYKKLKTDGKISCNIDMIPDLLYEPMYAWMSEQMKERLGSDKYDADYPIWAWAIFEGKNKRPDLRKIEFSHCDYPSYFLEVEIPDDEILLSDEEDWNIVMGDILNSREEDDWNRIFRLVYEDGTKPRFVQACFGELKLCQVVSVKVFGKHKKLK